MERFGETKKVRGQTEVTLGIKTQQKVQLRSGWLLFVLFQKNEQGREFRSEDLQEESSEREAWKRQHNQFIIQNKQMLAQQSQSKKAIQALQLQLAQVLAFLLQRVKWFISSQICSVLFQRLYLIFSFVRKKTTVL